MIKDIYKIPSQILEGYNLAENIKSAEFDNAVVCGMGGSAIAGQMAEMLSDRVAVHSNFDLPARIPGNTLIVCVSWSGTTEETVSSLETAHKKGLPLAVITTGGPILEKAKENNAPIVLLPKLDIRPRVAVGLLFGALVSVLEKAEIIERQPINELSAIDALQLEDRANRLAHLLADKIPLIYTSERWKNIGEFWKDLFNENAKIEAFSNWAPKLDHNEIAGLSSSDKDKFAVIIIEDSKDDPRIADALGKIDILLESMGYAHDTIDLESAGDTEKIFRNFILASLTSVKLAENKGIIPEYTPIIDRFKKI